LGGATTTTGGCAWTGGGVTTTAGGAAGFSGAGGAGGIATMGGAWRGAGTTTGLSTAGAAGFATTGFSAAGGCAACGLTGAAGAGGTAFTAGGAVFGAAAAGCCCCSRSFSSLSTSPGLEILERSIFGLISGAAPLSLEAELDLAEKYFLTFSASSTSMELEWVFFSVTPTSSNASRMALLFTSSSLARSLIRIFIRCVFPPEYFRYAIISTSRL